MKPSNLQTVHLLKKKKKKKTEPCSVEKKGLNTFAKSVNLHLAAQAMDLMNPDFGNIYCIINHENAITSLFSEHGSLDFACGCKIFNLQHCASL